MMLIVLSWVGTDGSTFGPHVDFSHNQVRDSSKSKAKIKSAAKFVFTWQLNLNIIAANQS